MEWQLLSKLLQRAAINYGKKGILTTVYGLSVALWICNSHLCLMPLRISRRIHLPNHSITGIEPLIQKCKTHNRINTGKAIRIVTVREHLVLKGLLGQYRRKWWILRAQRGQVSFLDWEQRDLLAFCINSVLDDGLLPYNVSWKNSWKKKNTQFISTQREKNDCGDQ